jgi:hypothetical protein
MSDNEPRIGGKAKELIDNLEKRVQVLESTVKSLLEGMKEAERETGEPLMPTGEYYGIKFED